MGQPFIAKVGVLGLLILLVSSAPGGAAEPKDDQKVQSWQVGFSPTYSSGNYGTASTTNITYLPVAVRRFRH